MRILLVGYGQMGQALFQTWRRLTHIEVAVVSPHCPQQPNFFKDVNLLPSSYQPEVIVFSVKPQIFGDISVLYRNFTQADTLVISVVAGVSIKTLENLVGGQVVRAMPNLAISVGQGVVGLYSNSVNRRPERKLINSLFENAGMTLWVESEELIDGITAISGSGPAYFYYFTECLSASAEKLGFSKEAAVVLAKQTFLGAAAMCAEQPEATVTQLRQKVTSSKGTTAAALGVLEKERLERCVNQATQAAFQRAQELSK